jgi:hypothetical protein
MAGYLLYVTLKKTKISVLFRPVKPQHMNAKTMKRKSQKPERSEMRAEYDFSGAVRGKYYGRYLESTNVVVLDPDVHEKFKNASEVNDALRTLIRATGGEARSNQAFNTNGPQACRPLTLTLERAFSQAYIL